MRSTTVQTGPPVALNAKPLQRGGGDVGKLLAPIIEHFAAANLVPAHASLPGFNLHTRHYISNTGLYDVWVMYNEMGKPVTTDLVFLPGFHAVSFADVVSGRPLQITCDPSGDRIRDIKLGTFEIGRASCRERVYSNV